MFRFFYILSALFFGFAAPAQSIDHTMRVQQIDSILEKAKSISKSQPDSSMFLLEQVKPFVVKQADPNLSARHALQTSWLLLKKDNFEDILELLAPNLRNKEKIDATLLGNTYMNIGHVYKMKWIPDSALVNYIKSLKITEKANDRRGISLNYLALGLVYDKLGNEAMALDFYDKSIKYSTNTELIEKHKEHITDHEVRPVARDNTIELALDIAKIAKQQNNQLLLATTYSDLKGQYLSVKNYSKALEYADKEMSLRQKMGFTSLKPGTWVSIAKIYAIQNREDDALKLYSRALPSANDTLKLSILQEMKEIYLKKGDVKSALSSLETYTLLKDSIAAEEREKSIAAVMAQFETELQAEQIKTLSAENDLQESKIARHRISLFGTLGASLLVLILGYFVYRNYKSKQELNYTQLNFKLLQSQMNPHFIFNALNEVSLNLDGQSNESASKSLMAYSKLMRSILQGSAREFITLWEDIELISKFLEVQQMGHDNAFDYTLEVDENLDAYFMEIPPMFTQPFVENAVLHGVKNIEEGNISISYQYKEDKIRVEIKDNGNGFVKNSENSGNELHTSMGTSIIGQRIETYKKLHNYNIEQKLTTQEGMGTCVVLLFPLKIKQS